jgi:hypothetical protein
MLHKIRGMICGCEISWQDGGLSRRDVLYAEGTISEIEKLTTTIMSDEGGLKPLRAVFMNGFLSFTPQDLQRRQMKDELICDPVVGFQRQPYKRRAEPVSQLVPPFYSACIPMYLFAFSV